MINYHEQTIAVDKDSHAARFWERLFYQRLDRICRVHSMVYGPSLFLGDYLRLFENVACDPNSLKKACSRVEQRINELLA
jgi:hypothetical protein